MSNVIDLTADYHLTGAEVAHIRKVARRLNDPKAISWDERRDLANLLDLVAMKAKEILP